MHLPKATILPTDKRIKEKNFFKILSQPTMEQNNLAIFKVMPFILGTDKLLIQQFQVL